VTVCVTFAQMGRGFISQLIDPPYAPDKTLSHPRHIPQTEGGGERK
jgi:hypothetical protein